MILPLLHHGMYIVGVPFTERALTETRRGGTPYGASHTAVTAAGTQPTEHETAIAQALVRRVASLAVQLRARPALRG